MNKPFLGVAYYPEDWDESEIPADIERMKSAGIKCARIAEFSWRRSEPEEGRIDFTWLHHVTDELGKNGISVVMGTPTATPPVWLLQKHPEAAVLNSDGVRTSHGGRRHCCSNVPAYAEASDRIVTALAEEFGNDKNVVGWQIDNEIYNWGSGCCCEYCVSGFRRYLKEKYKTTDELNRQWNLNLFSQAYSSFDEIPPAVNAWHNPHLIFEWNTFKQLSHMRFVHRQAKILGQYTKAPVGTDMMPVNGLDYEETNAPLDIVMFNHYNDVENIGNELFWFDYLRTLKDAPFWNTETATSWNGSTEIGQVMKPEGFCRINSWLPVAFGGEANMYWLFRQHWAGHELLHGALYYPSGKPFHIISEVKQTSDEFEKASAFISGTAVSTDVAVHFTSKNWRLFETQRIVEGFDYCGGIIKYIHDPLTSLGFRPDVIGAQKELSGYKLIFSPFMMTLEDAGLPGRILQWVKDGGVWVAGPMCDIRNTIGAHYRNSDTGMLEKITDSVLSYSVPDSTEFVRPQWSDGKDFTGDKWYELYTPGENAEVLVGVKDGHSAVVGKAVVFRVKLGRGEIIVLGSMPSEEDMKKIISLAAADAGISPVKISGGIAAVPRKGENTEGLILAEYKNEGGTCVLPYPMTELLSGRVLDGRITLKPYDILVLEK